MSHDRDDQGAVLPPGPAGPQLASLPPSMRKGRKGPPTPGAKPGVKEPEPVDAATTSTSAAPPSVDELEEHSESTEPPSGSRSPTLLFDPGIFGSLRKAPSSTQGGQAPPDMSRHTVTFGSQLQELASKRQGSNKAGEGPSATPFVDAEELMRPRAETLLGMRATPPARAETQLGMPAAAPHPPRVQERGPAQAQAQAQAGQPAWAAREPQKQSMPSGPAPQKTTPVATAPAPQPAPQPRVTTAPGLPVQPIGAAKETPSAASPAAATPPPAEVVHAPHEKLARVHTSASASEPDIAPPDMHSAPTYVGPLPIEKEEGIILSLDEPIPDGGDTAVIVPTWVKSTRGDSIAAASTSGSGGIVEVVEDDHTGRPSDALDTGQDAAAGGTVRVPRDPVREKTVLTERPDKVEPAWTKPAQRQTQIFERPEVSQAPAWAQRTRAAAAAAPPAALAAMAPAAVAPTAAPAAPATVAPARQARSTAAIPPDVAASPESNPPAPAAREDALGTVAGLSALLLLAAFALPRAVQGKLIAPWNDLAAHYGPTLQSLVFFVLAAALAFPRGRWRAPVLALIGALALAGASLAWREASLRMIFHGHPGVHTVFGSAWGQVAAFTGGAALLLAGVFALGRRGVAAGLILGTAGAAGLAIASFSPSLLGGSSSSAPFDALFEAAQSATLRGDRVGALALLVFLGCGALGLLVGAAGKIGAVSARVLGTLALVALVTSTFVVAAYVSQTLFSTLEPMKLAALLSGVMLVLPLALATAAAPKAR